MHLVKKIILCTPFNSTWLDPMHKALLKLGFQVQLFDYRNLLGNLQLDPVTTLSLLPASLIKTALKPQPGLRFDTLNHMLVSLCHRQKPDYLLVIKGESITASSIDQINSFGVTTLLWQVDASFHPLIWPLTNTTGRHYNIYISCEPGSVVNKLKRQDFKKVLYMLGAADGFDMKFLQSTPKKYDVTLVGTHHFLREKYLQALKGLDVHVWGWGPWQKSSVASMFEGKALTQIQMRRVYSQSKIVVNVDRNPQSTIPTNLRPFEAAQVGAFILTNYKPYLKDVFKIGQEIICFKSPADLRHQVNYYLAHPQARRQVAKSMFTRVKKDHTYQKRLKKLFQTIAV